MAKSAGILTGITLGAGAMYLLDPDRGRRRRALVRDKGARLLNDSRDALNKASQDLTNRVRGAAYEGMHMMRGGDAPDSVIEARVRARLGRVVSHPSAIQAIAQNGNVILRGHVLHHELDSLLSAIASVPGVHEVRNELQSHKTAEGIPDLQGGGSRSGERWEILQTNWTPAVRGLAGLAGGWLLGYGLKNRGAQGMVAGGAGIGLLARALTNKEFKRIVGIGAGRRAVDIQKTLNISAPLDEVFTFWTKYENFPKFMNHIREVRDLGNGRSHWVAVGPAGASVAWDAEVTELVPKQLIAWKSTPGSTIENAGMVRFDRNSDDSTRLTIRMCYNPPAGTIGHAVASIFGADPKHELDDDLIRLKSLLERGKTRAHGHSVLRNELI